MISVRGKIEYSKFSNLLQKIKYQEDCKKCQQ